MHYIQRTIEKMVAMVDEDFKVVMLTGPRQIGKTTLLQKMLINLK